MSSASLGTDRLIGGRYELEALLGKGGMGEVWRARHVALRSPVAIKFLYGASASDEATRKRFLKEAQVTANLKSRYAVQVFDFGVTDDGLPYLVMELLDGETLDKRIAREGRLPIVTTLRILQKAARALERAHALGIVHRDFKPENVMVFKDEEGHDEVKVVDFGIAKLIGELEVAPDRPELALEVNPRKTFTRTGNMVGTPYYMSPEQVNDPTQVGPTADLWAFGVVAYECLTGARPFDGGTVPLLFGTILAAKPLAKASALAPVPPAFDEWFQVACAQNPSLRFPDAQTALTTLMNALDPASEGESARLSRSGAEVPPPPRSASPFSQTQDARSSGVVLKALAATPEATEAPPEVSPAPRKKPLGLIAGVAIAGIVLAFVALRLLVPPAQVAEPRFEQSVPSGIPVAVPAAPEPAAAAPAEPAVSASSTDPEPAPPGAAPAVARPGPARAAPKASASASARPVASAAPSAAPSAPPAAKPQPASPFQLPPLGL